MIAAVIRRWHSPVEITKRCRLPDLSALRYGRSGADVWQTNL